MCGLLIPPQRSDRDNFVIEDKTDRRPRAKKKAHHGETCEQTWPYIGPATCSLLSPQVTQNAAWRAAFAIKAPKRQTSDSHRAASANSSPLLAAGQHRANFHGHRPRVGKSAPSLAHTSGRAWVKLSVRVRANVGRAGTNVAEVRAKLGRFRPKLAPRRSTNQ